MNPDELKTAAIVSAARTAYCNDRRSEAVRLYAEAAESAREDGRIADALENQRWHGNSLIWNSRHVEALQTLLEVATNEHPQNDPGSVFGAQTDCIMISLFHAKAPAARKLIEDARGYLARVGKNHWRHRLELLTCMLFTRQGRFAEAAERGLQSYRISLETNDGPRFTEFAHFKWIVRACFRLRSRDEVAHWLQVASNRPFQMVSDQIRLSCIRLAHARLLRSAGEASPGLLPDAQQALGTVIRPNYIWEEYYDVASALMIAGELDQVLKLQLREPILLQFEDAALAAELQINLLRRELGLCPWDAELNYPAQLPDEFQAPLRIPSLDFKQLTNSLRRLLESAKVEDERSESSFYSHAAQLRCQHARALLRHAGIPLPNGFPFPE